MNAPSIRVSAVVIRDTRGRLLTVRKRGTNLFMLPGGKPEPGETFSEAAVREVREELGVDLAGETLQLIGTFTTEAANEAGHDVVATLFTHDAIAVEHPAAEIEELRWIDPAATPQPADLAPLLTQVVLPWLRRRVHAIAVFTGAREGASPQYRAQATELGRTLARAGITLVYGGGKVGLMGAVADAALDAGGRVVGVMPRHLVDGEISHPGLSHLEVVTTMHERKQRMSDLADAFVALPGGAGTLDELFEAWTWQQLGLHAKPVAVCGQSFWAPLIDLLDHMSAQGFIRSEDQNALVVADTPEGLLDELENWSPPPPKWRT